MAKNEGEIMIEFDEAFACAERQLRSILSRGIFSRISTIPIEYCEASAFYHSATHGDGNDVPSMTPIAVAIEDEILSSVYANAVSGHRFKSARCVIDALAYPDVQLLREATAVCSYNAVTALMADETTARCLRITSGTENLVFGGVEIIPSNAI